MAINLTTLKSELNSRITELGLTGATYEEILLLSTSVNNIDSDKIVAVANTASLPVLTGNSMPAGQIFFVESLNVLVISGYQKWVGLDGRILVDYETYYSTMSWGYNNNGQLGDNTVAAKSSPVSVVGGIKNWAQVSAGFSSLGVAVSGIAYGWGNNAVGQLGDGTTALRSSPVSVVGGLVWSQISAGSFSTPHSLGITTSGIAYGWGNNNDGKLGDGTATGRSSPVSVVGGLIWSQVSAGYSHSMGITTSGIAYAWGRNEFGRLGDGTIVTRASPVSIIGGITNWKQVSCGQEHSIGITTSGIAYGWGYNNFGQLGTGNTTGTSSPVTVVGGITNWTKIATGYHTLGLTSTGILYGWGLNAAGELGDNSATNKSSPVTVVGGITNWTEISAGINELSLGITSTGIAYAWGSNSQGQLGDLTGTATSKSSPVTVVGGITNWTKIAAGNFHSIAIKAI